MHEIFKISNRSNLGLFAVCRMRIHRMDIICMIEHYWMHYFDSPGNAMRVNYHGAEQIIPILSDYSYNIHWAINEMQRFANLRMQSKNLKFLHCAIQLHSDTHRAVNFQITIRPYNKRALLCKLETFYLQQETRYGLLIIRDSLINCTDCDRMIAFLRRIYINDRHFLNASRQMSAAHRYISLFRIPPSDRISFSIFLRWHVSPLRCASA